MSFSIFLVVAFLIVASAKPFDGLHSYELLNYPPISTTAYNLDVSQTVPQCLENDVANISFIAYSRRFKMRLQKVCQQSMEEIDEEILSSGDFVQVTDVRETLVYFQGYLEGESNSTVDGTIENGVFQGVILTEDRQKFIIERLNPPVNGSHSFIFHAHSKKEAIVALFAEGSGRLPTDIINDFSGDGSGSGLEIV